MPWHVAKTGQCPASKPYGVITDSTGAVVAGGCHATNKEANAHMAALTAAQATTAQDLNAKHPALAIDVVRAVAAVPELRHADGGADALGTLVLRFSTFNTWYEVDSLWEGLFLERTQPGAFKRTIREDRDRMRVLFDHGMDFQLGNKVLGPIADLREDPDSPVGEVPLFDTSYNRDLLPGLKAGVYGSSMRMRVLEERWNDEPEPSDDNPKAIPERTITRVKVLEFGPVAFPANPDASAELAELASAGVRSLTDSFYERLRHRDEPAFAAAVRAASRSRPDFTGRPEPRRPGGGDPGSPPGHGAAPPSDPLADPLVRDRLFRMEGILS